MKIRDPRILLAGAALAAAFLGGIALAPSLIAPAAAQVGPGTEHPTADRRGPGHDPFSTAARYIGITVDQLRSEMGTTKSLADVAVAHGKTRDGLIQALVTAETQSITQRTADLVDHKGAPQGPRRAGPGHPGDRGFGLRVAPFQAAATYLGLSLPDLRTQLGSGRSLAQIAAATSGKSRDGLIQAVVHDETATIDRALSDGKLTADQATRIKQDLTRRVTALVDRTGPAGGPRLRFGPPQR